MTKTALNSDDISKQLELLNKSLEVKWTLEDSKLTKTFIFTNFIEAFGFMTRAALYAEKADHHPEWFNVYKSVKVQLTTHEAGGITEKDFDLAEKMEALL
jgi:4a-hydroxytetrahydrobiopterin dehydratase